MYLLALPLRIVRLLKTPLGARVMRPDYGSELYKLRDREFDDEFKILATKYIYEAIRKNEPEVKTIRVDFKVDYVVGKVTYVIYLDEEKVEVNNND